MKKLSIASGKGGTGKTMFSSSIFNTRKDSLCIADLDVEEPNLHIFLKPVLEVQEEVLSFKPVVDEKKCSACGKCSDFCQFGAIAVIGGKAVVFPEMCHSCGGCFLVCPENALEKQERVLGHIIKSGKFFSGRLKIGEAEAPALIKRVMEVTEENAEGLDIIYDSPPGTSCSAMMAVSESDKVLLVTEPTPFGLHDLELAVEAFSQLNNQIYVAVNRAGVGDRDVYDFCNRKNIQIIAEVPFDEKIAVAYSKGEIISEMPEYRKIFSDMAERLFE